MKSLPISILKFFLFKKIELGKTMRCTIHNLGVNVEIILMLSINKDNTIIQLTECKVLHLS